MIVAKTEGGVSVVEFKNGGEMEQFLKDRFGLRFKDIPGILFSDEFSKSCNPEVVAIGFAVFPDNKVEMYYQVSVGGHNFIVSTGGKETMFFGSREDLLQLLVKFKNVKAFFDLSNLQAHLFNER